MDYIRRRELCCRVQMRIDLILLNPEKERILTHADMHSAVDYTCYEGMAVKGEIELVMQRGHVIDPHKAESKERRGLGR